MAVGGNRTGVKWNKGGALRRNKFRLDTSGIDDLVEKLDGLGGNIQKAVTQALEEAAETVQEDTKEAVKKAYLPAKGQYSGGDTEKSIVDNVKVEWSGTIGEVGVGFDKTQNGAGGFLITGTPRMAPDYKLEDIYVRKRYKSQIVESMKRVINEYITDAMEGRK